MGIELPNLENEEPTQRLERLRADLKQASKDKMNNLSSSIVYEMRKTARKFMSEPEYENYFIKLKEDLDLEDLEFNN